MLNNNKICIFYAILTLLKIEASIFYLVILNSCFFFSLKLVTKMA